MSSTEWKYGCAAIAGFVLLFAAMVGVKFYLERAACYAKFENSSLPVDWGILSRCRVKTPEQGWIPAANYRVL